MYTLYTLLQRSSILFMMSS